MPSNDSAGLTRDDVYFRGYVASLRESLRKGIERDYLPAWSAHNAASTYWRPYSDAQDGAYSSESLGAVARCVDLLAFCENRRVVDELSDKWRSLAVEFYGLALCRNFHGTMFKLHRNLISQAGGAIVSMLGHGGGFDVSLVMRVLSEGNKRAKVDLGSMLDNVSSIQDSINDWIVEECGVSLSDTIAFTAQTCVRVQSSIDDMASRNLDYVGNDQEASRSYETHIADEERRQIDDERARIHKAQEGLDECDRKTEEITKEYQEKQAKKASDAARDTGAKEASSIASESSTARAGEDGAQPSTSGEAVEVEETTADEVSEEAPSDSARPDAVGSGASFGRLERHPGDRFTSVASRILSAGADQYVIFALEQRYPAQPDSDKTTKVHLVDFEFSQNLNEQIVEYRKKRTEWEAVLGVTVREHETQPSESYFAKPWYVQSAKFVKAREEFLQTLSNDDELTGGSSERRTTNRPAAEQSPVTQTSPSSSNATPSSIPMT